LRVGTSMKMVIYILRVRGKLPLISGGGSQRTRSVGADPGEGDVPDRRKYDPYRLYPDPLK